MRHWLAGLGVCGGRWAALSVVWAAWVLLPVAVLCPGADR